MTTAVTAAFHSVGDESPFVGADICREAGFDLPAGTRRPIFDDDLWDFTDVIGLPVQMPLHQRRFDFTAITDPRWRLVAKELVLALLAPRHPAVAPLPRAYRTALHLRTCAGRLAELSRFFHWLADQGLTSSLAQVDARCCEAYLAHRRYVLDEHGTVVGSQSPAVRRAAALVPIDLVNYRELFTADRPGDDLVPWGGATASAVAEMPNGRDENKTQPVEDSVLQPVLAAALYLLSALGPHAVTLAEDIREADRIGVRYARKAGSRHGRKPPTQHPEAKITALLAEHERTNDPLPLLPDRHVADRIAKGWAANDSLVHVSLDLLARRAVLSQFSPRWLTTLREPLEETLAKVGADREFGRNAASVAAADDNEAVPWTLPLHRLQAVALVGIVRTAAVIVLAAVSGMRSSELMELTVGCRRPPEEPAPGLTRYRLVSKVIKGQELGGIVDEWVVIEPAYRAVELIEQLHPDPREGATLLGRFAFDVRYRWFRNWINSQAGQRLGLAPIPTGPVTLRRLRRTLALEMAYRPGGVLATKIHLKHIAVATTEGYSSRPGGAQAELLAEVNKHESEHNLQLVLDEFRNYQQGTLPVGPGARELTAFFASVDAQLDAVSTAAPKTQRNDRDVLNLLTKRARTLHLGPANYCWFTDPSRALCLKLAGTPAADRPLVGMCDSARCPQATHHPCHRPVWAEYAERTEIFLGQLGTARRTERTRLQGDYDRALRVVTEIDAAGSPATEESA
ncbi:site-specific integrase [Streptomyces chartreusis]|uniref:site-specific integrase n=1 Tax=Streptomyces chartreusis TaxID=1969 RepID=UPI002F915E1F|nr:site-specific integrase [Streptomyces chartreusis]